MKEKLTLNENSKRTIFISFNETQINDLNAYLMQNKFNCFITTLKPASKLEQTRFSHLQPKVPLFYIITSDKEQYEAFEVGKAFAVQNDLDDIICCYPNLDFDTIRDIKEREFGLNK